MSGVSLLLVASLAVWRLSSLVVREDGPGAIFARIRRAAGAEDEGELSGLAQGITCVWCVSVWAAAGLYGLFVLAPRVARALALVCAASAGAIVVDGIVRSEH